MTGATTTRAPAAEAVITLRDVTTRFGDHVVHDGISLEVRRA